jgi:hypothetical protein
MSATQAFEDRVLELAHGLRQLGIRTHVAYGYRNHLPSALAKGDYHLMLDEHLSRNRLRRAVGDPLCKPRRCFSGIERAASSKPSCRACAVIAERLTRALQLPTDAMAPRG